MCIRDRRACARGSGDPVGVNLPTRRGSNREAPALSETAKIASGGRTWNCAGPETASKLAPK
eukprot:5212937-Alexandrium_andersonii.AAC.1